MNAPTGGGRPAGARTTPLRVDAQRNLEHVLRAAREVFGELGYGAPMEDVARRARVGVGTVYRRFPSKDVLVRRIRLAWETADGGAAAAAETAALLARELGWSADETVRRAGEYRPPGRPGAGYL